MNRRTMILSPHCDDAPLSLGASLLAKALGVEPTVHIVFSVSFYLRTGFFQSELAAITRLRQAEECHAGSLANYVPVFWDLPEIIVRRSQPSPSVDRTADCAGEPILPLVIERMEAEIARSRADLVLMPVAPGGHPDHTIVRDAAIACAKTVSHQAQFAFYEDVPYVARMMPEELRGMMRQLGCDVRPVTIDAGCVSGKLDLLKCYPSQLDSPDIAVVGEYYRTLGGERLWVVDNGAASWTSST